LKDRDREELAAEEKKTREWETQCKKMFAEIEDGYFTEVGNGVVAIQNMKQDIKEFTTRLEQITTALTPDRLSGSKITLAIAVKTLVDFEDSVKSFTDPEIFRLS
jgi:hypothetical protein